MCELKSTKLLSIWCECYDAETTCQVESAPTSAQPSACATDSTKPFIACVTCTWQLRREVGRFSML